MPGEIKVDHPLKPKDKRPIGRPAIYKPELAAEFCRRIREGRSERSVCKDADMPSEDTIERWEQRDPDFSGQYARAREARAALLVEQSMEIVDGLGDAPTSEQIQAARLRVDTRKWFASKLAPKKYGERLQTDATVTANVTGDFTHRLAAMTDDELGKILADAAKGGGVGVATPSGE